MPIDPSISSNTSNAGNPDPFAQTIQQKGSVDPNAKAGTEAAQRQAAADNAMAQIAETGSAVIFSDTIKVADQELPVDVVVSREDNRVFLDFVIRNPGSPILPPPNKLVGREEGSETSTTATSSVPESNDFFNSSPLTAIGDAFSIMMRALQEQKRLDKMIELQLGQISYQMSLDSAKMRLELGKLEQQEHMFKALVAVGVGIASAGASAFLPKASTTMGAAGMAGMEALKGGFNALGEGVSAIYAMPKASLEASKQVKDAVNQLILASKDAAAQAAKEGQDELNRILQQLSDIIQKYKDAIKLVQG